MGKGRVRSVKLGLSNKHLLHALRNAREASAQSSKNEALQSSLTYRIDLSSAHEQIRSSVFKQGCGVRVGSVYDLQSVHGPPRWRRTESQQRARVRAVASSEGLGNDERTSLSITRPSPCQRARSGHRGQRVPLELFGDGRRSRRKSSLSGQHGP